MTCVVAAINCILPSTSAAADFEFLTGAVHLGNADVLSHQSCNIRMSGKISSGDAAKFKSLLDVHGSEIEANDRILGNPRVAVLCLNSIGGALDEALKIAEIIRQDRNWDWSQGPFIHTRLEPGATCQSACALVFLAGTVDDWEGPPTPARSMHPTARLGIHAPNLNVPNGQYSEDFVTDAYQLSMESIADILRILYVGDGFSGEEQWIKPSMLQAMLETPHDEMRFVETVDDAGRWGINVSPISELRIDEETLFNACFNTAAWRDDRSSTPYGDLIALEQVSRPLPDGSLEEARYVFPINELDGISCEAAIIDQTRYVIAPISATDRETVGQELALFDPDTTLGELASMANAAPPVSASTTRSLSKSPSYRTLDDFLSAETAALSQGKSWGPRYGGDTVTTWDHNGSMMAWEFSEDYQWIWYFDPRPGLRDVGVRPGTLLLVSELHGEQSGLARRFSSTCQDIIYPVKDSSVELFRKEFSGVYRRPKDDCSPGEQVTDKLVFDFVASAAGVAVTTPDLTAPNSKMMVVGVRTSLNMRAGPSAKARKLTEVPANYSDIELIACRPKIEASEWSNATLEMQQTILRSRWCSFEYSGKVGFVSGKFLSPASD